MKYITPEKAVRTLYKCAAVIVDDDIVTYPYIDYREEKFLSIPYEVEGKEHIHTFYKSDNERIGVHESFMFLTNSNKEEVQVTLLQYMNIEEVL